MRSWSIRALPILFPNLQIETNIILPSHRLINITNERKLLSDERITIVVALPAAFQIAKGMQPCRNGHPARHRRSRGVYSSRDQEKRAIGDRTGVGYWLAKEDQRGVLRRCSGEARRIRTDYLLLLVGGLAVRC